MLNLHKMQRHDDGDIFLIFFPLFFEVIDKEEHDNLVYYLIEGLFGK